METLEKPTQEMLFDLSKQKFGVVAGMIKEMVSHPFLTKSYFDLGQNMESSDQLTPQEKQVIFLAVSSINQCISCIKAHENILKNQWGLSPLEVNHIKAGSELTDSRQDSLLYAAILLINQKGHLDPSDFHEINERSISIEDLYEIVGLIALKTITNMVNNINRSRVQLA